MNDPEFTKLLTLTARAASKLNDLASQVCEESERRYGVNYSDADAEGIVDVLDYIGADKYTAKQFHDDMKLSGFDLIDN